MFARSIGKRITQAYPGIYLIGAKIGKPVYYAGKILGINRKAGKKIARLYWKYGNALLDKDPGLSKDAYRSAERFVPCTWKVKLMKREDDAFKRCQPLAEQR
ncbi:MAG: hypothetical protein WC263_04495 [Candidatus Micrarchaeia archaeon]|jgi:hypothetical protein